MLVEQAKHFKNDTFDTTSEVFNLIYLIFFFTFNRLNGFTLLINENNCL